MYKKKSGKEMRFGKGTGELKATDGDGNDINMTQGNPKPAKKIQDLLADTKWDNTDKFGEGDFALRLTLDDNDIKVELVDKSNFNGGKEYVMDSQTIKGGATANGTEKVTLAGQEIKFTDLAGNFVAIQNNGGQGNKSIKTLDININKSVNTIELKNKKRTAYLQFSFIIQFQIFLSFFFGYITHLN